MGLTRLGAFLHRHQLIALDTSIFIDQLEANRRYADLTDRVFKWLEQPGHSAVTSTITMAELLVQPYRTSDDQQANEFYGLLSTIPILSGLRPRCQSRILPLSFARCIVSGLRTRYMLQWRFNRERPDL